ncbi:alpha-L-arabinofuranosidase C-terminal domain-containing protein [Granulicella aggregans]|uniref:alpha-L-arabinofuranosidase C-terminal domain-containing protein n=1 Tax=Granulicella aggregans TaxID=474949 RepID=UPI0021DFD7BD|nr:alpha-L-arabinofuranosidase C-terminal domain-containing protein [Granulicella aggregans]
MFTRITAAALLLAASTALFAAEPPKTAVIAVDATHPGASISPSMFGIFFEDINFGADGGLYPELVKNRSFEFSEALTGWHEVLKYELPKGIDPPKGELDIRTDSPLNATNPHYLRAHATAPGYAFYNVGYRGMGVTSGAGYRFSAYIRSNGPKSLRATLTDPSGKVIGTGKLEGFMGNGWTRYETVITPTATVDNARLTLYVDDIGDIDMDMVSLFPVDTWKNRPNGLRRDLVQLLYDMHPGFVRFPGGCIVEGRQLITRYRWKTTVGDISERKTIINRWNDEFDFRPAPDYFQSFGLGFYEYFQLAEDLGAKPLPILNCGMACQFNSSETAALGQLDEYVQDALDLIDFANGPVTSPWGKLRAQMGHPEPFHLEMLGVGNEQWGPRYVERYKIFAAALKSKHPEIKLVVAAGPAPSGEPFESMWKTWREQHADFVDEHYYMSPDWFLTNTHRYDHYDRNGPKVFAGEYAAQSSGQTSPENHNNWQTAIAEAAFMTGLERNGDVVRMASYAPLLANKNAWQWKPDAIWFDNLHSYGTTDYYVQKVFANNAGTRVIPITPLATDGLFTSAVLDERTHELIVKAINNTASEMPAEIQLKGIKPSGEANVTTLASTDLKAENTFDAPTNVAPQPSTLAVTSPTVAVKLQPYSLTVYRFPMQ